MYHLKTRVKNKDMHVIQVKQELRMWYQCLTVRGPSFYLKYLVKKGALLQTYKFQSYAPSLATAPYHDEQVYQIWC